MVPKVFAQLDHLKKAIAHVTKTSDTDTQLTLLVKQVQMFNGHTQLMDKMNEELMTYWKGVLGPKTGAGFFENIEIGTVFVAGSLSELFLHDVDGKKLGALTKGPYGILRGLGIEESSAADYVEYLNQGRYLLLIRTARSNINGLKDVFESI